MSFPTVRSPQPAADGSNKLVMSQDNKSLQAASIPPQFSKSSIKLKAISKSSGVPVIIHGTEQQEQTFTISASTAAQLPKLTSNALPEAIVGMPYGKEGSSTATTTLLNPYLNNVLYLTQTTNGSLPVEDFLTFTRVPQSGDCGWLAIDGAGKDKNYGDIGNLYNSQPVTLPLSGSTCTLSFLVNSSMYREKRHRTLTMKINVRNQKYIAPKWSTANIDIRTSTPKQARLCR